MQQTDVIDWIDGEITTVLTNSGSVSLSNPDDHAGLAQRRHEETYPYVGIQMISSVPMSAGIGNGELFVAAISTDNNGVVTGITYARESTLRVELIPVTDGDEKLRDQLTTELEDHFALLARQDNLHSDMDALRVEEAGPQGRPDDFVRGTGIPIEIDYERQITDNSITAAETVNVDIDVGDQDTDISESSDADAYDDTV